MTYPIQDVSQHSSIYRGFLLLRRPATVIQKIARYEVTLSEQSFGLFDSKTQASDYIDELFKKTSTGIRTPNQKPMIGHDYTNY